MSKSLTITKIRGLKIQPNSMGVEPGAMEEAVNIVCKYDDLATKSPGFRTFETMPAGQVINSFFQYETSTFCISQNTVYRLLGSVTAKAISVSGSPVVTVLSTAHGMRDADVISTFQVTQTDSFVGAFAGGQTAFYGTQTIQAQFTAAAARSSNVVTVTLANHGMPTGSTISVTASTTSPAVATGTKTITSTGANTFTFADTNSNSTATVTFTTLDAFRFTASQSATASVTSAAGAASYDGYTVQGGQAVAVASGFSKFVLSNKNAYFTTDNGVMKLESATLPVLKSGIPPGLDVQGTLGKSSLGVNTGPLLPNAQVAYRILFGRNDANLNEVLGAPSESSIIRNVPTVATSVSFSSHTLTITYASHGFATGETCYLFSCVAVGATVTDGQAVVISNAMTNTFDLDLSTVGLSAVTNVTSTSFGVAKTVTLNFTIPSEIVATTYIYRVYRGAQSTTLLTAPGTDFDLVQEANIAAADVVAGFVTFVDESPDFLVAGGAALYTNSNQEGVLQANSRPPLAGDVALFRNYVFMANVTQYRALSLALVAPNLITSADIITLGGRDYVYRGNATNAAVGNTKTTSSASTTSYVEVSQTAHGLLVNDVINVIGVTGVTGVTLGANTISAVPNANTFRFGSGAGSSGTVTYEGVSNGAGARIVTLTISITGTTVSQAISATAKSFIKAINRDPSAVVYAQYLSPVGGVPGQIYFEAKNLNASSFAVTGSSSQTGQAFQPVVPTTGTAVSDTQTITPNTLAIAKILEPEAVPLTNTLSVGSQSAKVLRIAALRDSLIVAKEDGVFRVNGYTIDTFVVTALDTTVVLTCAKSFCVLNNSVYCLTNQGVVQITDSAVRIISRDIEPYFTSINGFSTLDAATAAFAYEAERLYVISTLSPNTNSSVPGVTYCYNYLTDSWSTWTEIFTQGLVSAVDGKIMLTTTAGNVLRKERKDQTKIDFTGQEYCVSVDIAVITTATTVSGSNAVTLTFLDDHNYSVGGVVTTAKANLPLATAFSGGASDVQGLNVVLSVPTTTSLTFAAVTNATGTVTNGTLLIQHGISEVSLSATTVSGTSGVAVAYSGALGTLVTLGQIVKVDALSAGLAAAFASSASLVGSRSASAVSAGAFTLTAAALATSSVSAQGITITDKTQDRTLVTVTLPTGLVPQIGDALISGTNIYKINSVLKFSATQYVISLEDPFLQISTALVFLHSAYNSKVKFAPIHGGNVGKLKGFPEFQATFKQGSSCSQVSLSFGGDGTYPSGRMLWNKNVATGLTAVSLGGWGELPWGTFPWGGGTTIDREFGTTPAVTLRVYVPLQAAMGTFIQPVLEHKVAGESFDLQSITILIQSIGDRTSR